MNAVAKAIGVHPSTLTRRRQGKAGASYNRSTYDKVHDYYRHLRRDHGLDDRPRLEELKDEEIRAPGFHDNAPTRHFKITDRNLDVLGYVPGVTVTVDPFLTPRDGDVVCVQLQGPSSPPELKLFKDPYLINATTDPDLIARPVVRNDDRVRIVGVVVERGWRRAA